MANHLRVNFITVILLFMMTAPTLIFAQNKQQFTLWSQVNGEYRDNITREPDFLKLPDYRTNLFFAADYQNKLWQTDKYGFNYELRFHRYKEYQEYNRQDHLLRGMLRKSIYKNLRFHLSNEFRTRYYSSANILNYRRNIFDSFLSLSITRSKKLSLGYQNWLKTYPNSSLYQSYFSNRFYLKINQKLNTITNVSAKFEYQTHSGNLYPGSTASDQRLNLKGDRYVFLLIIDKLLNRKIFSSVTYRFENDLPEDIDVNQIGENIGDENSEELFTEDFDFGYLKHQLTFSTLFKINSRISLITFYLFQYKRFHYWKINENGGKRKDKLLFLSSILKIKMYKNTGLEVQYNLENNVANLFSYKYTLNSISIGLFWQP